MKFNVILLCLSIAPLILLQNAFANDFQQTKNRKVASGEKFGIPFNISEKIYILNENQVDNQKFKVDMKLPDYLPENYEKSSSFSKELNKCIKEHQIQMLQNLTSCRNVLIHCFKAAAIFQLVKYLQAPPDSSIKVMNGYLEFKKMSNTCRSTDENNVCKDRYINELLEKVSGSSKGDYKLFYNLTKSQSVDEVEHNLTDNLYKENVQTKIKNLKKSLLLEVARSLEGGGLTKVEEEEIKKELTEPHLLQVVNAFFRNYVLRIWFRPEESGRIKRSRKKEVNFGMNLGDSEEVSIEEESEENESGELFDEKNLRKSKYKFGDSKRKKKKKKGIKKWFKPLMIPFMIQLLILPFFLKSLVLLGTKALLAGKVALLLLLFNFLRNYKIQNHDYNIRVQHYGYKGEEYGAWFNGRSFRDDMS